jgi:hypothetical protein
MIGSSGWQVRPRTRAIDRARLAHCECSVALDWCSDLEPTARGSTP